MLSFIFVIVCVFLSGSESVQFFLSLLIYVLQLDIQLSREEGWNPINQFNAATFVCMYCIFIKQGNKV